MGKEGGGGGLHKGLAQEILEGRQNKKIIKPGEKNRTATMKPGKVLVK